MFESKKQFHVLRRARAIAPSRSRLRACALIVTAACVLIAVAASTTRAQPSPAPLPSPVTTPTGYINDYANVIDAQTKSRLETILTNLKKLADIEIAVVTVPTTNGEDIFDYSLAVARGWGIGSKDGEKLGLLLVVAVNDRKYFTQVSRHLEGDLPDGLVGQIQRERRFARVVRPLRSAPGDVVGQRDQRAGRDAERGLLRELRLQQLRTTARSGDLVQRRYVVGASVPQLGRQHAPEPVLSSHAERVRDGARRSADQLRRVRQRAEPHRFRLRARGEQRRLLT